jgi:probable phosphoglycerate mutase
MLYLIRHGLTLANRENRFAGRSLEPLCKDGISQLEELGKRLRTINLDHIFTGPLPRTVQSAEIIGRSCDVDVEIRQELNEIYLPHWDGLTKDEIRRQYGRQYPTWLENPAGFAVPGCETLADVQQRAVNLTRQILRDLPDKNILLVTHLIVGRCLVLFDQGLGLDRFRSIKIANGQLENIARGKF